MKKIFLHTVDSTNNYIARNLAQWQDERLVVVATRQTAGRGNGQNSWHSEEGMNLTFSILIHPKEVAPNESFIISEATALAIADALSLWIDEERIRVKWPNDIYIVPDDCKISGTLIETTLSGKHIGSAILGIGLNINETSFPSTLPNPISIAAVAGHETDCMEVLTAIIERLEAYEEMLHQGQYAAIRERYLSRLYRLGTLATYKDAQHTFQATIEGVATDGHLLLRSATGQPLSYAFKEIQFI